MPACIVLERWDYSLSDWNNKLQRQPDDVELKSALYMVSSLALPCPALLESALVHFLQFVLYCVELQL